MRCVVLRHTGHAADGLEVIKVAADDLARAGLHDEVRLATLGHMYLTAAYTSAAAGQESLARGLYDEGRRIAARFSEEQVHGLWFFGPLQAETYGVSIANNLGDPGMALTHAARVTPAALPSTERRERYYIDVARTHIAAGNGAAAADAIRAAARVSPQSASRPRVQAMVRLISV
jgi:hypothetical protein